jgi:hypothetical protein
MASGCDRNLRTKIIILILMFAAVSCLPLLAQSSPEVQKNESCVVAPKIASFNTSGSASDPQLARILASLQIGDGSSPPGKKRHTETTEVESAAGSEGMQILRGHRRRQD